VASAARGQPLGDVGRPVCAFGEVGLTGELRSVAHPERRMAEARKFGLEPLAPGTQDTLRDAIASVLTRRAQIAA
jgi:DNA repair protein RadA/Sms